MLTTTEAARTLHLSTPTVAAWCRSGRLAASKVRGRWAIAASTIARALCPATDRPRKGQHTPVLTARAVRRATSRIQARRTAKQYGARVIGHVQRARIAAANAGFVIARSYLESMGLDPEFTAKYESAFGRAVAKTYRANHGAEPRSGGLVVLRGRIWHCFRYAHISDLHAGAKAYKRTADLFGLVA